MSSMGESIYTAQTARTRHTPPDQSPYSAVSSFNLEARYDSSLVTPISMSTTPSVQTKPIESIHKEVPLQLEPPNVSPGYHLFSEEDFGGSRYQEPMKHKDSLNTLHASTPDSAFPASYEPYWGSFGVSATPGSTRTSISSPPMHPASSINSAGGLSNDSCNSRQPTPGRRPSSYGTQNQTPILIAPNPETLRKVEPYRQNSLNSNHSTPHSQGPAQGSFPENITTLAPSKKRKTPEYGFDNEMILSSDLSFEEQLLLQLSETEQLPWKDVMNRFNERTGKSMKVAALQMRKKRLVERLRVWTDTEERALTMAWEEYETTRWDTIAKNMLKHGCTERWTKEAVQRKWHELHPEDAIPVLSEYELMARSHHRSDVTTSVCGARGSWSEVTAHHGLPVGPNGTARSLPSHDDNTATITAPSSMRSSSLVSPTSTVTMDEVRSLTTSDTNAQLALHQQQAQLMFEDQQRKQQQSQQHQHQQHQHHQQHQQQQQQQQHHRQQQQQHNSWTTPTSSTSSRG